MFGVSIARREFPDALIQRHQLGNRITRRHAEAEEEIVFMDVARPRLLPVWMDGQLLVLPWKGWREIETLQAGEWGGHEAEIPATFGFDAGVWYTMRGIRCAVVARAVYPIRQPSTHYYEVMTRQPRMPLFVGETI
ncbi:hypothetical protein SH661x_001785 [Planctomicrobium sp. SH661]|uniref:hypothetical protein n=1 Tax=Planctomicrobium sp. SH661 TaxID=3448124 RepID=UPI003F5B70AA